MKRKKLKNPQSIQEVLSSRGVTRKLGDLVSLYQMEKAWRELVGDMLAQRTYPKRIQGNNLLVAVENSSWSHQLSMLKEEVLLGIERKIGHRFSDIRFVAETGVKEKSLSFSKEVPSAPLTQENSTFSKDSIEEIMKRLRSRLEKLREGSEESV